MPQTSFINRVVDLVLPLRTFSLAEFSGHRPACPHFFVYAQRLFAEFAELFLVEPQKSLLPYLRANYEFHPRRRCWRRRPRGRARFVAYDDFVGMTVALIHYYRSPEAATEAGGASSRAAAALFEPEGVVARYEGVDRALLATRPGT